MKTLTLREPGDKVFWLNAQGFQEGKVKTVHVNNETLKVAYRCSTKDDTTRYQGDLVEKDLSFSSYIEMLGYYDSIAPKSMLPVADFETRPAIIGTGPGPGMIWNLEFLFGPNKAQSLASQFAVEDRLKLRTSGNGSPSDINLGALYYNESNNELLFVFNNGIGYFLEAKQSGNRPLGICSYEDAKAFLHEMRNYRRRDFEVFSSRFRVFTTEAYFNR